MYRTLLGLLVLCVAVSDAKFNDCHERWKSGERKPGVYEIHPNGTDMPVKVWCEHSVDATFTVIQRRYTGKVSFHQPYAVYQQGFGDPQHDYWAGLDTISALTQTGNNFLRIDLTDWSKVNPNRYATYHPFSVLPRANYYQMFASGFSGNIPDDLSYQSGNYFFTYDAPDQYGCAANMRGGWWYYYCAYAHLNGVYYPYPKYTPNPGGFYDGIYWKDWHGFDYSLKFVTMSLYRV